MRDHIGGYSFSWTQPYVSMNPVYQQINVENEIARMDFLEEQIREMSSYPDAEKILKKIVKNG